MKAEATTRAAFCRLPSKYPPAKPEALFVEPLKAAEGPLPRPMVSESSYVDVMMPNSCAGPATCLGRANTVRHSGGDFLLAVCLLFSVDEHLPYRYGFSLLDTSNFCCHPGRAGGTPLLV